MNQSINQHASTADFEFSALNEAKKYREALIADFTPYLGDKTIEIGSGIGQMTQLLSKIKKIKFLQCIEPDSRFSNEFKKTFPNQPLIEGTIRDVKTNDWDSIVSINVLEHIEADVSELELYNNYLKNKHGLLCLFIPARPEIYAPIDKDFGHFRRYTKDEIKSKLENAGFEIEVLHYYNCVGYFAWWLNFCVLKQRSFNILGVRIFDRFIFPIVHFLESRISPPPFGQSLFVIARSR